MCNIYKNTTGLRETLQRPVLTKLLVPPANSLISSATTLSEGYIKVMAFS